MGGLNLLGVERGSVAILGSSAQSRDVACRRGIRGGVGDGWAVAEHRGECRWRGVDVGKVYPGCFTVRGEREGSAVSTQDFEVASKRLNVTQV